MTFFLCVGTDGASTVSGTKGGVVGLLREDAPGLLAFHCQCHKYALVGADVGKKVPFY